MKLAFSGAPNADLPLHWQTREVPAEDVRRVWNEGLRDYEAVYRHHDAR